MRAKVRFGVSCWGRTAQRVAGDMCCATDAADVTSRQRGRTTVEHSAIQHSDFGSGVKAKERREVVKRLETVPGVGPIVALTTIAVFAEVGRFPSAKQAASYSGLVPSTFQSGDRDAHGRITKRGSAELRTMPCDSVRETETGNPSESVSGDAINERAHAHPRRSGTRSLLRGSLCTQNYGSRRSALPSGCPTSLPFRRAPSRSLGPWDPSAGSTC